MSIYVCMYIYVYVYMYICISIYVYIGIYRYTTEESTATGVQRVKQRDSRTEDRC